MCPPTFLCVEGAGIPTQPVTKVQILPEWDDKTAEAYAHKVFPNAILTRIYTERPEAAQTQSA